MIFKLKRGHRFSIMVSKHYIVNQLDLSLTDITIKRELGGGNFGAVYLGTWKGSDVALKKVTNSGAREDLLREAALLAYWFPIFSCVSSLNHPNIVRYYGIWSNGEHDFIVMEYLKLGSLLSWLPTHMDLSLPEMIQMYDVIELY